MIRVGTIVRDKTYASMWRVVQQDGELSDMVNKQRACELARLLIRAEQRAKQGKAA